MRNAARLLTNDYAANRLYLIYQGEIPLDDAERVFGRWRQHCPADVAWNLIVVAWDYSATERGSYPGYDDANKNMPLPAGRNALAANEILRNAKPDRLAGLSSDLFILHVNSRSPAHDGPRGGFYEALKRGEAYRGYYATPFQEVVTIFAGLRRNKAAQSLP